MQATLTIRLGVGTPSVTEPDARIARAAAGDRAAAEAIVRELLPRIRNLVRYLVRGDADVDDMAQIAMIAILRGLGTFRGEGSLNAWADRITVRESLAYVKSRRKRDAERREMGAEVDPVSYADAPDAYLTRRHAVEALDTLPDEQRSVIVLHHIAGLSMPEAADELCIPFETARSRLRLGMTKLRSILESTDAR